MKIPVTKTVMPKFEEYVKEIEELWDNRWLSNRGIKHKKLEEKLKEYLSVKHIGLFVNGHQALEATLDVMDLEGEIITTPFTFVSTTHAIVRNGLTPVYCDININDYTIDTSKIEELITEKTSAILPVHVYGNVCNVIEIERIAKKYNLKVIYDAAHAFGEKVGKEDISNFGDASMFSFHATKIFHSIEGGAVVSKNKSLINKLNVYQNFGQDDNGKVSQIGTNVKMNEFQAAMGICNLRNNDEIIVKRKNIVNRYIEQLFDIDEIKLNNYPSTVKNNYSYFPILIESEKINRDELLRKLANQDIHARKYFYPLTSELDCYTDLFPINDTPVAKYVSQNILTLPLFPELELDQVDLICRIIKDEVR